MRKRVYIASPQWYFSNNLRTPYNLQDKIGNDQYVYCRSKKGMYWLKQAARLAFDDLVKHLSKYGYHPDLICQNIWLHKSRKTKFCLCVDNFGVKVFNQNDKAHLIDALKAKYEIIVDASGEKKCGLTLD